MPLGITVTQPCLQIPKCLRLEPPLFRIDPRTNIETTRLVTARQREVVLPRVTGASGPGKITANLTAPIGWKRCIRTVVIVRSALLGTHSEVHRARSRRTPLQGAIQRGVGRRVVTVEQALIAAVKLIVPDIELCVDFAQLKQVHTDDR